MAIPSLGDNAGCDYERSRSWAHRADPRFCRAHGTPTLDSGHAL